MVEETCHVEHEGKCDCGHCVVLFRSVVSGGRDLSRSALGEVCLWASCGTV